MRKAVLEGFQRLGEFSLRPQHIADLLVGDREIALPTGIGGIGLGEAVGNGEAVAKGFQGFGQVSLCPLARRQPSHRRPRDRAASSRYPDGLGKSGNDVPFGLIRLQRFGKIPCAI